MPAYDGSVRINTKIDNKEAQARLTELEKSISSLEKELNKKTTRRDVITEQLRLTQEEAEKARQKMEQLSEVRTADEAAEKARASVASITAELEKARQKSDEIFQAMGELRSNDEYGKMSLGRDLDKATDEIDRLDIKLEEANAHLQSCEAAAAGLRQSLGIADADTIADATTNISAEYKAAKKNAAALSLQERQLTQEIQAREGVLAQQRLEVEQINADLLRESMAARTEELEARVLAALETIKAAALDTGATAAAAAAESSETATASVEESAAEETSAITSVKEAAASIPGTISSSFTKGLKMIVRYGLGMRSLFVLYRKLRTALVDGIKQFAKYDEATRTSLNDLKLSLASVKGALTTAFAPIFNVIAPAINTLLDLISRAASAIAVFVAVLGGKTTFKRAVANISDVASAASAAGSAAAEAKKQFSGLDEMNVWQSESGGGGGGGGGSGDSGLEFVEEEIDASSTTAKIAEYVRQNFESVALLVDEFGFILGVILMFSGHPALGLGMMLFFGYQGVKEVATNWDAIKTQLQGSMGAVYAIVGAAMLAIGAILTFSGVNLPVGIAMMALGAADLVTTAVLNWGAIKQALQGPIGEVSAFVGSFLLALGALLTFSGANIPLGIGLMAAGAVSLGSAIAANWNTIKARFLEILPGIETVLSGAALVLGAVLTFSGASLPLGIALLATGAAGLATAVTVNWNTIKEKLQGPIAAVTGVVSGATLVLGILALMAGNVPLGLGLILSGAAGLATTIAANWENLKNLGKTAIGKVKEGWDSLKEGALTIAATVSVAVEKAKTWVADAWTAAKMTAATVVRKVQAAVEKAATWVADAWAAAKMGASNVLKTVKSAVVKAASWVSDAWAAAKMGASNVLKTVKSAVVKAASWVADAWAAAKMGASNVLKTVKSAVVKAASWVSDAWAAAKMGASNVLKTVKSAVVKAASWVADAWTAAKMISTTVLKKVQSWVGKFGIWGTAAWTAAQMVASSVLKTVWSWVRKFGTWVADAWTAAKMGASTVLRTVKSTVKKATTWIADAWTAAKMGAATILRTLSQTVKKGSTWISAAWEAAQDAGGTIYKTLQLSVSWIGSQLQAAWNLLTGKASGSYHSSGSFAGGGVYSGGVWHDIAHYASGTSRAALGQIFVAREAGPELVGTLQGHTAVMNNDQIVASVSAGVARAIAGIRFQLRGFPSVTPDMVPGIALGQVVPPRLLEIREDLQGIRSTLDRIAARLSEGGSGGNTYNVTAQANGRALFDLVLQEGQNRAAITGRNPFAFNLGGA